MNFVPSASPPLLLAPAALLPAEASKEVCTNGSTSPICSVWAGRHGRMYWYNMARRSCKGPPFSRARAPYLATTMLTEPLLLLVVTVAAAAAAVGGGDEEGIVVPSVFTTCDNSPASLPCPAGAAAVVILAAGFGGFALPGRVGAFFLCGVCESGGQEWEMVRVSVLHLYRNVIHAHSA